MFQCPTLPSGTAQALFFSRSRETEGLALLSTEQAERGYVPQPHFPSMELTSLGQWLGRSRQRWA